MSDIPEADAQEQRQATDGDDDGNDRPRRRDDVNEADAQEQAADVSHVGRRRESRSAEVPEADAAEQDYDVPDDEDDID